MVKLWPEVTVITNIEEDHLDVYRDLQHIQETFAECAQKTRRVVLVNADDVHSRAMVGLIPAEERRVEYYASETSGAVAEVRAVGRGAEAGAQHFTVKNAEVEIPVVLQVPGAFNMMNATAAASVALACGIAPEVIASSLSSFTGIWRRFERVGEYNGATILSDYGHHPTAIKGTVAAAKEFFPGRRLVVLFEPHQHSRTKELFVDFSQAFAGVDVLVLSEIYRVAGRTEDDSVTSEQLLAAVMATSNPPGEGKYAADLAEAERVLRAVVQPNDVVVVMGAGNVDDVARKLCV
jgi:UDP-N-acetylmuramate--alanine ligase